MKKIWNKIKVKWKAFQEIVEEIIVEMYGEVD